jgi:3-deoxy-manno-octulosonate cytidylyltransferase (CMP-KDO synthetase)
MKTIAIIPSRYGSTRFKGKPLADILGKSMIQRVYEQCKKSSNLTDVIVATDDNRIYDHVLENGGKAVMTSKKHKTGTERCNEAAQNLAQDFDLIINVQGDEPFINPLQIDAIIQLFNDPKTKIGTLAKKINDLSIIKNKNTPKAIFDKEQNALNFCREIDAISTKSAYYKHIGIYAYKKDVLKEICSLPQSKNEIREGLEQLRWLDNNYKIKVGITTFQTLSVDTPQDVEKIKDQMR